MRSTVLQQLCACASVGQHCCVCLTDCGCCLPVFASCSLLCLLLLLLLPPDLFALLVQTQAALCATEDDVRVMCDLLQRAALPATPGGAAGALPGSWDPCEMRLNYDGFCTVCCVMITEFT